MILVFSSPDLDSAYVVRDLLGGHGIAAQVFNENVNRLPGALFNVTPDAWPAVYISDDSRAIEAKALIAEFEERASATESDASTKPPWTCSRCGEENAATFEICWKC